MTKTILAFVVGLLLACQLLAQEANSSGTFNSVPNIFSSTVERIPNVFSVITTATQSDVISSSNLVITPGAIYPENVIWPQSHVTEFVWPSNTIMSPACPQCLTQPTGRGPIFQQWQPAIRTRRSYPR